MPVRECLRALRRPFLALGLLSVAVNLLLLTSPLFMMQVYDRVLASRHQETLLLLLILALVAYAAYGVIEWARLRVLTRAAHWLERRNAGVTALAGIDAALAGHPSGAQGLRDLQTLRGFLASPMMLPFFDAPWTPIFLGTLFLLHPYIGFFGLGAVAALAVIAVLGELTTRRLEAEAQQALIEAYRWGGAVVDQASEVTALGMRSASLGRLGTLNSRAEALQDRAAARSAAFTSLSRSLRQMVQVGVLAIGAWLVLAGEMSGGAMIAGSILLGRALAPVEQAVGGWRQFAGARLALRRLADLQAALLAAPAPMPLPRPQGNLSVERLYLRAPNQGPESWLLRDVSFRLEPGQAIGIVGPSGAGKSTLCHAIVGLLAPSLGQIRLGGARLDSYAPDVLGSYLGFLPQETLLPSVTVAEMIARLRSKPEPEGVWQAAKAADAHELILGLPQGYDTPVGEGGVRLSGGQRQRIALARAFYGDPLVLVLDEPAAHLDEPGIAALQGSIAAAKARGQSVVMVAHRPSLVQEMDLLLVLSGGAVQQFGPRDVVLQSITAGNVTAIGKARSGPPPVS